MPTKRILVTGVSRDLGSRVARTLAADEDNLVVGVDVAPLRHRAPTSGGAMSGTPLSFREE